MTKKTKDLRAKLGDEFHHLQKMADENNGPVSDKKKSNIALYLIEHPTIDINHLIDVYLQSEQNNESLADRIMHRIKIHPDEARQTYQLSTYEKNLAKLIEKADIHGDTTLSQFAKNELGKIISRKVLESTEESSLAPSTLEEVKKYLGEEWLEHQFIQAVKEGNFQRVVSLIHSWPDEICWDDTISARRDALFKTALDTAYDSRPETQTHDKIIQCIAENQKIHTYDYFQNKIKNSTFSKLKSYVFTEALALSALKKVAEEGNHKDFNQLATALQIRFKNSDITALVDTPIVDAINKGYPAIVAKRLSTIPPPTQIEIQDILTSAIQPDKDFLFQNKQRFLSCISLVLDKNENPRLIAELLKNNVLSGQKYEADVAKLFVQKLDLNNEDVLQTLSNLQSSDNIDEMKKAVLQRVGGERANNKHYPFHMFNDKRNELARDVLLAGMKTTIAACESTRGHWNEPLLANSKDYKLNRMRIVEAKLGSSQQTPTTVELSQLAKEFSDIAKIKRGLSVPAYSIEFDLLTQSICQDLNIQNPLNQTESTLELHLSQRQEQSQQLNQNIQNNQKDMQTLKADAKQLILDAMQDAIDTADKPRNLWRERFLFGKAEDKVHDMKEIKLAFENANINTPVILRELIKNFSNIANRKRGLSTPAYATEFDAVTETARGYLAKDNLQTMKTHLNDTKNKHSRDTTQPENTHKHHGHH